MKRMIRYALLALSLMAILLLSSCSLPEDESSTSSVPPAEVDIASRTVPKAEMPDANSVPLTEDESVYDDDDPDSLVYFYATIRRGSEADGTNHTLEEVNSVVVLQDNPNVEKLQAEILLQEGDEYGPVPGALGYGETEVNGTIRIRGRTSTLARQKSYRIDLLDKSGLWRGQRAIALSKHPNDPTRLRNKLYFDLLKDIPHMTSLRSQFVHLYVKDETTIPPSTEYVDYGLFTFIETPNRRFLRNHGLSREGNLYKANIFEFFRYEDELRLATDPLYDLNAFSKVLDSKNGEDHTKLLAMLDAVNDYSIPIETVVEQYFDIENMMSFLAYNMLMGNTDCNSQNFYLYSPVNSDTWYFLAWDGDGSLHFTWQEMTEGIGSVDWQRGISNLWGVVLYNRLFRVDAYREKLIERVEELRQIITAERIADMIAEYRTVVDPFLQRMPDTIYLPGRLDQIYTLYEKMPYDTDLAYEYFTQSLNKPMPFFLNDVSEEREGYLYFGWGEAYDFEARLVLYDIQVATDWTFAEDTLVYEAKDLMQLETEIPLPPPGEYWWRVVARNSDGETQTAFDTQETAGGMHGGMREFRITEDWTVENPS